MDFNETVELVSHARDKRSKPVANNTRVEKRDEDTYALRLHSTDVVTFHRDGRIVLRTGGWYTVTTRDRIAGAVGNVLESEKGAWFISQRFDGWRERPHRTVLKPFHALDPGPEPVKSPEGCIAGTIAEEPYEREKLVTYRELEPGSLTGWTKDDIVRPYEPGDIFAGYVVQRGRKIVAYGEDSWGERPSGSINDQTSYERCPHCKLFQRQHDAWDAAMNGVRWPRREVNRGYRQMVAALERYGSHEAWLEAYKADGRATRRAQREWREWLDSTRVPFVEGITLIERDGRLVVIGATDANGVTKRIDRKRADRELAKATEMRKRIADFARLATNRLADGMAQPGSGDCWYCAMREVGTGTTMGDLSAEHGDHSHLLSHIEEGYAVPSLLANAVAEAGYRFPGVILGANEDGTMGGRHAMLESVERALRKYLTKRLVAGSPSR